MCIFVKVLYHECPWVVSLQIRMKTHLHGPLIQKALRKRGHVNLWSGKLSFVDISPIILLSSKESKQSEEIKTECDESLDRKLDLFDTYISSFDHTKMVYKFEFSSSNKLFNNLRNFRLLQELHNFRQMYVSAMSTHKLLMYLCR